MNERRIELDLGWQEVADQVGITRQALLDIRNGRTPRSRTERNIERVLLWQRGSVMDIRNKGLPPSPIQPDPNEAESAPISGIDQQDSGPQRVTEPQAAVFDQVLKIMMTLSPNDALRLWADVAKAIAERDSGAPDGDSIAPTG